MIRSTRLQLCAPSMKRRSLPSRGAAPDLAFVLASRPSTWRRNVAVGCDAEDVIEAIVATPIEDLGTAIVAVGPQQDLGVEGQ